MKIGFVGTGAITEAIVTGLLKAKFRASEIIVSPRSQTVAQRLSAASTLVRIASDNQDVVTNSDIVILAVLPQVAEGVIRPLRFKRSQVVASLVATLPIQTIEGWINGDIEIARAVPLPFVADLNGVTIVHPGSTALAEVFSALGSVVVCDSIDDFDALAAVGAVMSTYFSIVENCARWLCANGVSYDKAQAYLSPFFFGLAASALRNPEKSFEELRIGCTTAGGLNEQLFSHFQASGGLRALSEGLDAVAERIRGARSPS